MHLPLLKSFSITGGSQNLKKLQVEHKKCNFLSEQCVGCACEWVLLIEIDQPSRQASSGSGSIAQQAAASRQLFVPESLACRVGSSWCKSLAALSFSFFSCRCSTNSCATDTQTMRRATATNTRRPLLWPFQEQHIQLRRLRLSTRRILYVCLYVY